MKRLYKVLNVGNKIDVESCEIRDKGKWYPIKDYELDSDRVKGNMKPIRIRLASKEFQEHNAKQEPRRGERIIMGIWKHKGREKVLDALLKLEYKARILKKVLKQKQNG